MLPQVEGETLELGTGEMHLLLVYLLCIQCKYRLNTDVVNGRTDP